MKTLSALVLALFIQQSSFAQIFDPIWFYTVAGEGYDYSSSTNYIASDGCVYSGVRFYDNSALGIKGTKQHWTNILLKFSPGGELIWKKHYESTSNVELYGIQELSNGNLVFCITNGPFTRDSFSSMHFGSFESTKYGASFLTLSPDGEEKGFFETPEKVTTCTDFLIRGDTIFAAYFLTVSHCSDPYGWDDHFGCHAVRVVALDPKDGKEYWSSKVSHGSMMQGLEVEDIQGSKLLVSGYYYNGDMHWGTYTFPETGRGNGILAILDSRSGRIKEATCFYGDDLSHINTASFGQNGKIYAGGFSAGSYMKGPGFDFVKRSKDCSSLFFELDEKLQVTHYEEGWSNHYSRVQDMAQNDDGSMWFTGDLSSEEWHVFDSVFTEPFKNAVEKQENSFLLRVDTTGRMLDKYFFIGTDHIIISRITKRGSKLMINGYYIGEFHYKGLYGPDATGTNAFYLMVETDPFAAHPDVIEQQR